MTAAAQPLPPSPVKKEGAKPSVDDSEYGGRGSEGGWGRGGCRLRSLEMGKGEAP
ncbi:hypothetical protein QJS04_geneDACA018871 [Acorus gramineus]|uniref:Uncharacterized protein n=1 Tax=Acorus gramineus TaxID=55184 RepID=A0AAV9BT12_ACOGR|nr:hypothetical protein QJS04_geneDACA018871 [Acorus gramineus]